jgi:hypothetical protein
VLIATEWVILLAGVTVVFAFELPLPAELDAYADRQEEGSSGALPIWWIVGIPVFVASIVASIGLWFFRRWARPLYALVILATIVMTASEGPVVQHALIGIFTEVSSLVAGATLGVAYFAPIEDLRRTTG